MDILIGKKLGMTQIFEESGRVMPVSVIQAGPCPIVQVKTVEKDGYGAIQLGFGDVKERRMTNGLKGHFKKGGVPARKVLREVRVDDPAKFKVGEALDVKLFEGTKIVDVVGTAKGRGFAGTIKRHNFKRGPETHGSKNVREPGSVGQNTTPGRIHKGKRMPGRLGGQRTTVKNLAVVQVDAENNLLFVKGAIPGPTNGFVLVKKVR
jgi:large subunit ribosomal protein L3